MAYYYNNNFLAIQQQQYFKQQQYAEQMAYANNFPIPQLSSFIPKIKRKRSLFYIFFRNFFYSGIQNFFKLIEVFI